MKLILLALTCVVFAVIVTACTQTATPTNTSTPRAATTPTAPSPAASFDEFANDKANYGKNCAGYQLPNGDGGLDKVDNKQIKVRSLHAEHAIKHTDAEIINFITNGHQAMPAFKDNLRPEEVTELVRFVRKVHQGKT